MMPSPRYFALSEFKKIFRGKLDVLAFTPLSPGRSISSMLVYANTLLKIQRFYFPFSVFRQGDTGKCWYAVLTGSLDVRISQPDADPKVSDIYVQHKHELCSSP